MQIPLAIVADAANLSQEGKLNICGAFNQLGAPQVPALHPQMVLVLRFRADPGELGLEFGLVIRLQNQDGQDVFPVGEASFKFPDQTPLLQPEHTMIMTVQNLPLPAYGVYAFRAMVNGQERAVVPFALVGPQPALPFQERPDEQR